MLGFRLHGVQKDVVTLQGAVGSLRSDVAQVKIRVAEALLQGKDKQGAKVAAIDAVKDAANAVRFPTPTERLMATENSSQIDDATKKEQLEAIETKEISAPKSAADAGVPECQDTLNIIKSSVDQKDLGGLKSADAVGSLKNCKNELDKHKQELDTRYKAQGCEAHPDTSECKKTADEMKQTDLLQDLVKVALVAAAIYLIMDGDVPTGLLLLSLANGVGNASSSPPASPSSAQSDGPAEPGNSDQKATPLNNDKSNSSTNTFPGTGHDIECHHPNNKPATVLMCNLVGHSDQIVEIDPTQSPDSTSPGRSDIALWFSEAIKANDGQAIVRWCTHKNKQDPSDWLGGIILKHGGDFYPIRIQPGHSGTQVVYSESTEKVQDNCKTLEPSLN